MLSASDAATPLVYDFSGFDQKYYQMTYETPDASFLAKEVAALMPDTEPELAPETLIDGFFMGLSKRSILVA